MKIFRSLIGKTIPSCLKLSEEVELSPSWLMIGQVNGPHVNQSQSDDHLS